ncbi:helix-turn-helix transcriptional regulator [Kibdelosporangium aridum]|uniref:helix-turn-helix transcriptional regulator n=1 Tax=Kibdelosporangium aridum TaxID=2030 RepID=UPI0005248EE3
MIEISDRAAELAAFQEVIAGALAGHSAVIRITGPAATGKTELANAFTALITQPMLVLRATALPSQPPVPFSVVNQLTNEHADAETAEAMAPLAKSLEELQSYHFSDAESSTRSRNGVHDAFNALCRAFPKAASRHPTVVVVDDIQHADDESLSLLHSLVRNLQAIGCILIVTESGPVNPRVESLRAEMLRHPGFRNIRIGRLSREGVAHMVGTAPGLSDGTAIDRAWYDLSGGNPLLVRALLQDYKQSSDSAVIAGDTFKAAVASCVTRCDAATRRVLHALAVLGDDYSPQELRELTHLDEKSVTDALASLTEAGLVRDGQFGHEAVRSAVADSMDPESRAKMHRSAAEMLSHDTPVTGSQTIRTATHLLTIDPMPDTWALNALENAAKQSIAMDDMPFAYKCLLHAVRGCQDQPRADQLTVRLAEVEQDIDPVGAQRHLDALGRAICAGHLDNEQTAVAIRHLARHGYHNEARAGLARLTGAYEQVTRVWAAGTYPALADPQVPNATLSKFWTVGSMPSEFATDDDGSEPLPAQTYRDTITSLAMALRGDPPKAVRQLAEHSLQQCLVVESCPASAVYAIEALVYIDHVDEAVSWHEAFMRRINNRRRYLITAMAWIRAEMAMRKGNPAEAIAYADTSRTEAAGWGAIAVVGRAVTIQANIEMDRHHIAQEQLRTLLPSKALESRYGLHYLYARARYHLAADQSFTALHDLLKCGQMMRDWRMDVPTLVPWRSAAAEAYVSMGQLAKARALADEQMEMPGGQTYRIRGISLRAKAATTVLSERAALLRAAISDLQQAGDQIELARAYADLGHACQRSGQSSQARWAMRHAAELARQHHAHALYQDLQMTKGFPSFRPAGKTLSEAEHNVAKLAARGFTNREIADQLFITKSTVEQHLTKIYRKLKVSGRKDIVRNLSANSD